MARRSAAMEQREPPYEPPTVDRMRMDISRGLTGEKVAFPDPAAAPLGTDDEAAGHSPTPYERYFEDQMRAEPTPPSNPGQGPLIFYFGFAAVLAVAIMAFAYLD